MRLLKIKHATFTILLMLVGTTLFAQQEGVEKEKKVVIITKTVDENGNVKTEKIVKKGEEANTFIMKNNGEKKEGNLNVDIDDTNGEKKIRLRIDKVNGEETETIEWKGDGEVPAEILKTLKDRGIEMEVEGDSNIFYMDREDAPNQACLGVMIGHKETVENVNGEETTTIEGSSDLGVPVLDIIEASGAEDAGLAKDDIIIKINETEVISIQDVIAVLEPMSAGEIISVDYIRDGATLQVNATLKACSVPVINEVEEEIEWHDEDGNQIEISTDKMLFVEEVEGNKVRKIIIKKKNGEDEIVEEIIEEIEGDNKEDFDFLVEGKRTLDLESIDIFPNPTEGKLRVQFTAPAEPTIVKVIDLNGREVYTESINTFDGKYDKEIDLSKAPKGALILSIQQKDKMFSEKLILQR